MHAKMPEHVPVHCVRKCVLYIHAYVGGVSDETYLMNIFSLCLNS